MKKKFLPVLLFASSLLVGLVSCDDTIPEPEPEPENLHPYSFAPASLDVSKKAITLGKGEKTNFITRISPVVAFDAKLVYSSDNEAVVTIDEEGELTAA